MRVADTSSRRIFRPRLLLGRGAFGEVYEAIMEGDGLTLKVALKLLHPQAEGHDDQAALRLRDEASYLAALSHRAIPRVYAVTEIDGRLAVAMEFIEGADGATVFLKGRNRPPVRAGLEILAEVAGALHAAHTARGGPIIHRDVKPSNLMVATDGSVRLMDFGIAAARAGRTAKTAMGTVLGTLSYMAPERFVGAPAEPSWDVYALGVMLYEAATGRSFWAGHEAHSIPRVATHPELLAPLVNDRLATLDPWPALQSLARDCLHLDPAQRPTATQFEHRARRMLGDLPGASLWEWSHGVDWSALPRTAVTPPERSLVGEVLVPTTQAVLGTPLPPRPQRRQLALLLGIGGLVAVGVAVLLILASATVWVLAQPAAEVPTPSDIDLPMPEAKVPASPEPAQAPPVAAAPVPAPSPPPPGSAAPHPPIGPSPAPPTPPPRPRMDEPTIGIPTGLVTLHPPAVELRGGMGRFDGGPVPEDRYQIWAEFDGTMKNAGSVDVQRGQVVVVVCSTIRQTCGAR